MNSEEPEGEAGQVEGMRLRRSLQVADLEIHLEPVPGQQVRHGTPAAGSLDLAELDLAELGGAELGGAELGGATVGIWEHTPGTSTDVEVDEVCLILGGRGTVTVHHDHGCGDVVVDLVPGTLLRLHRGERTTWVVEETLRKVYVVGGSPGST